MSGCRILLARWKTDSYRRQNNPKKNPRATTKTKEQRNKATVRERSIDRTIGATDFPMPVKLKDHKSYRKCIPRATKRNKSLWTVVPRAVATATSCAAHTTSHVPASTVSVVESNQPLKTSARRTNKKRCREHEHWRLCKTLSGSETVTAPHPGGGATNNLSLPHQNHKPKKKKVTNKKQNRKKNTKTKTQKKWKNRFHWKKERSTRICTQKHKNITANKHKKRTQSDNIKP